jgi:hypothetical protein
MRKILIIIISFFIGWNSSFTQEPDPYVIVDSLKIKLLEIEDYQADIEIEVDVDFIKMPVKHATIYYKQPDKVKFKSDEFFMLPRKGFNNSFRKILEEDFSAIYAGEEIIQNEKHHVIKIIPLGKKPDIILATWWINAENYLISRVESNTRNEGTFLIDFSYKNPEIQLPTVMKISFEIEKMKLPLKFLGKTQGIEIEEQQIGEKSEGTVYIRFSNYIINQNPDIDFETEVLDE